MKIEDAQVDWSEDVGNDPRLYSIKPSICEVSYMDDKVKLVTLGVCYNLLK